MAETLEPKYRQNTIEKTTENSLTSAAILQID